MNRIFDLQFAIGLFFLIVGLLLLLYYILGEAASGAKVNLYCGVLFVVFGGCFLFSVIVKRIIRCKMEFFFRK
ncbi:hypothetical protein GGU45_003585 [Niabella hirudinis]